MPFAPDTLAVFFAAAFALMITPGPDMLFVTANGIAQGPKAGVISAVGTGAGGLIHTTFAALGLSAIILAAPVAFDVIRYVGAAYLLWLGVQAIRNPAMLDERVAVARRRSMWAVFRGGVLCNVLNPKVAVFFIAFLPQFVDPALGSVALQLFLLGLMLTVFGTLFNALIGVSGGGIGRFLARRPSWARTQGWISGVIFIGLAVRLAVTDQRS